jgi:hypothetical protein
MPYGSNLFGARGAGVLTTALNTWFAANPTMVIHGFDFIARDSVRASGIEFAAGIVWETGQQALNSPFVAVHFTAETVTDLDALIQAAIAAAPNDLYRGPWLDYLNQSRRVSPYHALLVHTADAVNGATNWP